MKTLNIQIQPSRCLAIESDKIVACFRKFSENNEYVVEFKTVENKAEDYINIFLSSLSLSKLWATLKEYIFSSGQLDSQIASALIVICEGDDGWNDYLLLYHFDKSEQTDDIGGGPSSTVHLSTLI